MIFVVNAGSSSLKCALFSGALERVADAQAVEIGGASALVADGARREVRLADHGAALVAVLEALRVAPGDLAAVAHRVVHGGADFDGPRVIDAAVRARIDALGSLAPLHNPVALACIDALAAIAPGVAQVASFDTAFHAGQEDVVTSYALPAAWRDKGVRRYGFHGLSYRGLVEALDPLPGRLLACHLGNGASMCAIRDGRSVATSMGYSPVSGMTMGTRVGEIDANAVLRIAGEIGIDAAGRLLNNDSGLRALGGTSDMRDLPESSFARAHFGHWALRQAGGLIAVLGGIDAIAFTGGIGENDAEMRGRIVDGLKWAGPVAVHVVAADEERQIARETAEILGMTPPPSPA
ncbi:acetate kinase [Maribius pontilimi]|uniref:Acetate kinase n=1 Tax=Palleronia pontilimi TaxID=1964209 RepID=A0A934MDH8_9RHOB|nr:acetate kinase [Palleronia pontilimi]